MLTLKTQKTKLMTAYVLIVIGVAAALTAVLLTVHARKHTPHAPQGAIQTAAQASVKPSVQTVTSYSVPPNDPKYIDIPAIGVSQSRIIELGLLKSGAIAVPNNIYDTGWYKASALPGRPGAMFIYGHVSSWTANGVFYNLNKLSSGDKVIITRGDNTKFTYQVVSSKVYNYQSVDMNQVLAPVNPSKPGLNLMTCTGQVIKGTSEFNERLVVFTSLVSS